MGQALLASMALILGVFFAGLDLNNAGPVVITAGLSVLAVPAARGFSYALLNREGRVASWKVFMETGKVEIGNLQKANTTAKALSPSFAWDTGCCGGCGSG